MPVVLVACGTVSGLPETEEVVPVYNPVDPELSEVDGFDEETLYRLLLAEIAGRQEQHQLALDNYLWAARHTDNVKVISRAMSIANFVDNLEAAEELAKLWLRQEPEANQPHLALAAVALNNNDTEVAVQHLTMVAERRGPPAAKIWLIVNTLADFPRHLQLEVLDMVAANFSGDAETKVAYGRMLVDLDAISRAELVFADIVASNPENEEAAVLYASTLRNQAQEDQAISWLGQHLQQYQGQDKVRAYYARALAELELYHDAAEQLLLLLEEDQDDVDSLVLLSAVRFEVGQYDQARSSLEELVWMEAGEYSDRAAWQLGRIAEIEEERELALKWYRSINNTELATTARIRSIPLQHHGNPDATLAAFAAVEETAPQLADQVNEIKAVWLAENDMYDAAMSVYDAAIERDDNHFWRYSRAIVAEQYGGDLELFEQDMRHIISEDKDHAEALNALGYTLADKTDRFDEAYGLIYTALLLKPNNFYIKDSMGWVLFRLGYNEEALFYLEEAYAIRPDPEIAAHIVQVLIASGEKDKARKVLRENTRLFPDDDKLSVARDEFNSRYGRQ